MGFDTSRRQFLQNSSRSAAAVSVASLLAQTAAAQADSPRVKVGQIGVGHPHADGKMEVFRSSSDWQVVGVVEPDPELRREAEESDVYRGVRWMTEEELLNTPGLKAVAVETPVNQALDVAQRCIAAGMHIHLDKPAGADLEQFRRIYADADRQKLTIQMGYMYRYNPGIVLLHELLRKGWLGEIFEVHAVMSKQVSASKRKLWDQNIPGGTMFELGCHLVDLVVGLLGKPESVAPFSRQSGEFNDALVDNMLAVCTYPRAIASIKSTALEVEGFERRHLVVCGTEGTLQVQPLDDPRVRLALTKARGPYQSEYQDIDVGVYTRYIDDLADLARIIRGEKEADFGSAHDLAVQDVVLQASAMSA